MVRILRGLIFLALIAIPIVFYSALNKDKKRYKAIPILNNSRPAQFKPAIALLFDDLGDSLSDLRELYSLDIPLTVSIIPNLKFSKNIAHIASRCGFSVFIHLPLEPKQEEIYQSPRFHFLSPGLSRRENEALLRDYLNSLRIAIGVNNHMGSKATEDGQFMGFLMKMIKKRGLAFVDSRTSLDSVAYQVCQQNGLICGFSEGFLDGIDELGHIEKQIDQLAREAKAKGKIIIIAHPRSNTLKALKKKIPWLKQKINFITLKEYFSL